MVRNPNHFETFLGKTDSSQMILYSIKSWRYHDFKCGPKLNVEDEWILYVYQCLMHGLSNKLESVDRLYSLGYNASSQ